MKETFFNACEIIVGFFLLLTLLPASVLYCSLIWFFRTVPGSALWERFSKRINPFIASYKL